MPVVMVVVREPLCVPGRRCSRRWPGGVEPRRHPDPGTCDSPGSRCPAIASRPRPIPRGSRTRDKGATANGSTHVTAKASSFRRGRRRRDRRGLWPVRYLRVGTRHPAVAARPGPEVPAAAGTRPTTHGSLSGLVGRMAGASALATVFGQLVSFVATESTLARLLTPTDIGIFATGTGADRTVRQFRRRRTASRPSPTPGDLADADETVFWVTLMVGAAASLGLSRQHP